MEVTRGALLSTLRLATLTLGLQILNPHPVEVARARGATANAVLRTSIFPTVRPSMIAGFVFTELRRAGDLPRLLANDLTDRRAPHVRTPTADANPRAATSENSRPVERRPRLYVRREKRTRPNVGCRIAPVPHHHERTALPYDDPMEPSS